MATSKRVVKIAKKLIKDNTSKKAKTLAKSAIEQSKKIKR